MLKRGTQCVVGSLALGRLNTGYDAQDATQSVINENPIFETPPTGTFQSMEILPSPNFVDNFDRDSNLFEFSPPLPPDYDYLTPEEKMGRHFAQKARQD